MRQLQMYANQQKRLHSVSHPLHHACKTEGNICCNLLWKLACYHEESRLLCAFVCRLFNWLKGTSAYVFVIMSVEPRLPNVKIITSNQTFFPPVFAHLLQESWFSYPFIYLWYLGSLFEWLVLWLQLLVFSIVCLFSALLIVCLLAYLLYLINWGAGLRIIWPGLSVILMNPSNVPLLILLYKNILVVDLTLTYNCQWNLWLQHHCYSVCYVTRLSWSHEWNYEVKLFPKRGWAPTWVTAGRPLGGPWTTGWEPHAVGTWRGWGRGKYATTQGRRALEQKYSSPLNMSIRINALTNLPFRFIQVLSPVEEPKPGQRR